MPLASLYGWIGLKLLLGLAQLELFFMKQSPPLDYLTKGATLTTSNGCLNEQM